MTGPASTCFHEIIGPTRPTVTGDPNWCTTVRIRPLSVAD
jgi:hypothetical protein